MLWNLRRKVVQLLCVAVIIAPPVVAIHLTTLSQVCESENFTQTRICDPNHVLKSTNSIQNHIYDLENQYSFMCPTSIGLPVYTQFGLVIIDKMELQNIYATDEDVYDYLLSNGEIYAKYLHDYFGVGNQECGGTGMLLFISIHDRILYLSISAGLNKILTQSRISLIVSHVKPYMKKGSYESAILRALQDIEQYIDRGPPGFWEAHGDLILFLTIFLTVPIAIFFVNKKSTQVLKEYVDVKTRLTKLDRDRRLALMGKYQCTSCPICLEDFDIEENISDEALSKNPISENDSNHNRNSNDHEKETLLKKQDIIRHDSSIHILSCGHAFHQTCWREWIQRSRVNDQNAACPICRSSDETVTQLEHHFQNDPSRRNSWQSGDHIRIQSCNPSQRNSFWQSHDGILFHRERVFRLERLALLHPRYIRRHNIDRWINDDVVSLADDPDFLGRNPNVIQSGSRYSNTNTSERSGGYSSFSSFGGGTSNGNGGGGTW